MGAYDSLTLLGTTTCHFPSQTKGTPETELISSELNKIEKNKSTNSPLMLTQNGYYHGSTLVPVVVPVFLSLWTVGC